MTLPIAGVYQWVYVSYYSRQIYCLATI